jgi:signal transduction histidine kinase/CheY-like chemotaxis protein
MKKYFAVFLLLFILAGCGGGDTDTGIPSTFTSFRDIPGITDYEIEAVENLQRTRNSFRYASVYGTELFVGDDGRMKGFTVLFCNWLSEIFEIPFVPTIVDWNDLIIGLENNRYDFTGELSLNEEHRQMYFMTDDIAQRQIIMLRMTDAPPLFEIAETRPLRYAFLRGDPIADLVARRERYPFEKIFVGDNLEAYEMLVNREIDAFFNENSAEAAFGFFNDVVASVYYPIIFSPVSLATQNPDLTPIINIVQRALVNGAKNYLIYLYNQGHQDYLRHKFHMMLTDEERQYIADNPVIPFVAEITNYPLSFFEQRTNEWEGLSHDVLREIERVAGLTFNQVNDEHTQWPDLLRMLENGDAALITSLIPSEDRIGNFVWPGEGFFRNYLVLISKHEFRDINLNEIVTVRVGTVKDTAHGNLFREWFPNHRNITEYVSTYDAFDALERGDVDMVMVSEHQLLILTNYREQVGYKANYVFDYYFHTTFGLNSEREILASIITKAMRVIDVDTITNRWMRRTYDYRLRMAQERMPFMIGLGMLSVGLIFLVFMFVRKRREGRKLETLVSLRTKELSEAVDVAQEASRAKSDFLSSMSHEIRTPMNAIIGMAELLSHETLNERQVGYVNDITVSSKSLLGIINDILDFSKIESGKLELHPVDFELKSLVNNIDSMFTYVAKNKNLDFNVKTETELPEVLFGDDVRLRQVLINICGNAVKFTEKGGITLSVNTTGGDLEFIISDTGMGIKKEDLPRLFKAFEQLDTVKNRSVVGTGLGLSITKAFVDMMGGSISVDSEYGKGTAFTVRIPVVKGNPENIHYKEMDINNPVISAPDAVILVTDDNMFNLRVASGLLSFMDIEAETVDSGAKAIERVKQKDYDIVFMDHMMPEMDGVETVHRIREMGGKYNDLKIIALTANAIAGAREMFLENGFNDFVSKPIDAEQLTAIVQKYLPPEKIRKEAANKNQQQAALDKEEQLRRKSIKTFAQDNRQTFAKITETLNAGDTKTAHRLAHTLKSSAAYLKKMDLQAIALSLEDSLRNDPPTYTQAQLDTLQKELEQTLKEFDEIIASFGNEETETIQINDEAQEILIKELLPLLERADFGASEYVDKLKTITGLGELADLIDEFDFDGAMEWLKKTGKLPS